MVYEKTKSGNSPFLVENGLAYFSIKEDENKYSQIITTEDNYRLNGGKDADLMIKMGITLSEKVSK